MKSFAATFSDFCEVKLLFLFIGLDKEWKKIREIVVLNDLSG